MDTKETLGRGLAASAQFALVAFLSISFTTTTHDSAANTLSSIKTKVIVAAPSKEDLAAAAAADRLDKSMKALPLADAATYRALFEAQAKGNWDKADRLIAEVKDPRLMGHVLADRYLRKGGASAEALSRWLEKFPTLPDAQAIYDLAVKAGVKDPVKPQAPEAWSGGAEVDGAANFMPDLAQASETLDPSNKALAKDVAKALRRADPWTARDLMMKAQNDKKIAGTFAHDLQAAIAGSFFAAGERQQAAALSGVAAAANQPMGLWVQGLIAWEKASYDNAGRSFTRLAEHPALTVSNRAAAHFWAYRALSKDGEKRAARKHLLAAAETPRSFYGMLAAQLLDRNPVAALASDDSLPVWDQAARSILAENQAGWRALALLQVDQKDRAEAELRRLSPLGDAEKQRAMLALAHFIPMPGLVLQLANLGKGQGFSSELYPLPPWQPSEGFKIDRALLFALARHESLFDPTATSGRGAQGLMQIMPATARSMVDEGHALDAASLTNKLQDPAYNMTLGQKYVQQLIATPKIGTNLVMLLAAYNAGPTKATRWMSERDASDPLLFMESIPLRETRNYIARVMPHYWAYRSRLGQKTPSLQQMAEGAWPQFSPKDEGHTLRVASK